MEQGKIIWIDPYELQENEVSKGIYAIPTNYEMIKENINQVGILEPLIVVGNVVISGNLRLQIAKELKLEKIPVIFQDYSEIKPEVLVVSHGQQRIKRYSEILTEYEILEAEYPVGKGCRTDLDPEMKKNADKKKALNISRSKIYKLKQIKTLSKELYSDNIDEYNKVWSDVDLEKTSIDSVLKGLKRNKAISENKIVLPETFDFISEKARVYNKSCEDMTELNTKSIDCIVTSPPYFQMRDYGTGKNQRGLEKDIDTYIQGLINDFKDCKRVLKDDGSLWVNLGEAAIDGQYNAVPHRFVLAMQKEGWIFNDEWIWIKNNPVFTQAKRATRSHEYIFHFVKSKSFYYDSLWLNELNDPNNLISFGTNIGNLSSSMDFRENIVKTNASNIERLRKECKKSGFNLTHSAAFPITIPLISILATSKVGDTILDIYSGTSTTGEAALAFNRQFVGYEIKSEYIMASKVRLENYIHQEQLLAA